MSRYSYAGDFINPASTWSIKEVDEKYEIWTKDTDGERPLNPPKVFDEWEDAEEYITSRVEFFEEDYDQYLDENSDELARMERFEQWRNEY